MSELVLTDELGTELTVEPCRFETCCIGIRRRGHPSTHLNEHQVAELAVWLAGHVPADRILEVTAVYIDRRNVELGITPYVETWGE